MYLLERVYRHFSTPFYSVYRVCRGYSTIALVGRLKASENPSNHWKPTHTGPRQLRGGGRPPKNLVTPYGYGYSTDMGNTVVTPGTSTVPRQSRYSTGAPVRLEKRAKTTKVVFAF